MVNLNTCDTGQSGCWSQGVHNTQTPLTVIALGTEERNLYSYMNLILIFIVDSSSSYVTIRI